ncbi:MAG: nitrate- and nitrite sensing domain-containing protein, partial [Gammaproteobacteria bacterium]|nr:nitrate- and nitrite sensing domain-containing protein [Gammaproteobacteria bacterium]
MLDRLTLSQKLLVLILVPLLMVSYFSISQTRDTWSLRTGAAQLGELAAFGTRVSALVHELQKERGASAGFLGSKGAKFGPELAAQRKQTDARLAELRSFLNSFNAAVHGQRIDRELATVMGQIDQIDARR